MDLEERQVTAVSVGGLLVTLVPIIVGLGSCFAKQPRYPFAFFQADALEFVVLYGHRFDAIHASPPCQAYSRLAGRHPDRDWLERRDPHAECRKRGFCNCEAAA